METLTRQQKKDVSVICRFIEVYCSGKHDSAKRSAFRLPEILGSIDLCNDCAEFAAYAIGRRLKCPLEGNKPACKHCHIHCYAPNQRRRIQEIMAYSGKKLLMRGRIDYLWHYYF
jgi:hypothetical protein